MRPTDVTAFSVGAWVYGTPYFFSSRSTAGGETTYAPGVHVRRDHIYLRDNGGGGVIRINLDAVGRTAGQGWRQIFFTFDGSSSVAGLKAYVDGILAPSTAINSDNPSTFAGSDYERIGGTSSGAGGVLSTAGYIKHVMYFQYKLTAADVKELRQNANPADATLSGAGPYGWWPLDGDGTDLGSGGNDIDSVINFVGAAYRNKDTRPMSRVPYAA